MVVQSRQLGVGHRVGHDQRVEVLLGLGEGDFLTVHRDGPTAAVRMEIVHLIGIARLWRRLACSEKRILQSSDFAVRYLYLQRSGALREHRSGRRVAIDLVNRSLWAPPDAPSSSTRRRRPEDTARPPRSGSAERQQERNDEAESPWRIATPP
jgi:hypothetical protein